MAKRREVGRLGGMLAVLVVLGSSLVPGGQAAAAAGPTPAARLETPAWLEGAPEDSPEGPLLLDGPTLGQPAGLQGFEAVDACLTAEVAEKEMPGASLAIARDGQVVHTLAVGIRDRATGGTVDSETLFGIGSITKMMTAAAVLQQVEAGRLALDAPLSQVLPELRLAPPWGPQLLTLHHLLSHSTGYPDRYGAVDTRTLADWVLDQADVSLQAPPGSFFNYSNPNFVLAGRILEQASGLPFGTYLRQNVFERAGLRLTATDPMLIMASGNFATGHVGAQRLSPADAQTATQFRLPAGGVFSTPSELVRWADLLMTGGGTVLRPESVAAMTGAQVAEGTLPWQFYGYGVDVRDVRRVDQPESRVRLLAHGGSWGGWRALLWWLPEQRLAFAALNNNREEDLSGTALCALRELAGLEPIPTTGLTTDPATWQRNTGTYAMMEEDGLVWTAQVRLSGNDLGLVSPDAGLTCAMRPFVLDSFVADCAAGGTHDVTFIEDRAQPAQVRWMRNRQVVGLAVGAFPEQLTLSGSECSRLAFTPSLDLADVAVRGLGLGTPMTERAIPASQDDPEDPGSSSIRRDLTLTTPASFVAIRLQGEPDDDLDLFLLRDADGDGSFKFPGEVIGSSAGSTSQESVLVARTQAAGHYQVWVHGYEVAGTGSTFALETLALTETTLRLAGVPAALHAGQPTGLDVCPPAGTAPEQRQVGFVQLELGLGPRVLRIPVEWRPADSATRLYLPWTISGRG